MNEQAELRLKETTRHVIIEQGTEVIGDNLLSLMTDLKSVTIPASVTSIGDCAFDGCNLEKVFISETAYNNLSKTCDLKKIFGSAKIIIDN